MNIHVLSNLNDNSGGLLDLRPLALADEARFREATELEQPQSWLYYFPFLFCFAQRREMTLVWEEADSSICLYLLKTTKNGKQLALFVPPFPFNQKALAAARRARRFAVALRRAAGEHKPAPRGGIHHGNRQRGPAALQPPGADLGATPR